MLLKLYIKLLYFNYYYKLVFHSLIKTTMWSIKLWDKKLVLILNRENKKKFSQELLNPFTILYDNPKQFI